ncbi:hypothetical protein [Streptomyces sp. NBC_01717]|uniref:hypothetical protein n=1 Tax=Streptomyces sp. NBC_01717 TaxID=2975918 RepID=UPI003FCDC76A
MDRFVILAIRGCWVARSKPWDVDDKLWTVIEPLLPKLQRRNRHPGRKMTTAVRRFVPVPLSGASLDAPVNGAEIENGMRPLPTQDQPERPSKRD